MLVEDKTVESYSAAVSLKVLYCYTKYIAIQNIVMINDIATPLYIFYASFQKFIVQQKFFLMLVCSSVKSYNNFNLDSDTGESKAILAGKRCNELSISASLVHIFFFIFQT